MDEPDDRTAAKVFVVGHNKTGTTSVEAALASFGYRMGDQPAAELLLADWADRRFDRLFDLCRTADAFQDVPFSLWDTYRALDRQFPGSKFVLTIRNSSAEWYDSVVRWGRKLTGAQGSIPTADEMRAFGYRAPGWFLRSYLLIYGVDEAHVWRVACHHRCAARRVGCRRRGRKIRPLRQLRTIVTIYRLRSWSVRAGQLRSLQSMKRSIQFVRRGP